MGFDGDFLWDTKQLYAIIIKPTGNHWFSRGFTDILYIWDHATVAFFFEEDGIHSFGDKT